MWSNHVLLFISLNEFNSSRPTHTHTWNFLELIHIPQRARLGTETLLDCVIHHHMYNNMQIYKTWMWRMRTFIYISGTNWFYIIFFFISLLFGKPTNCVRTNIIRCVFNSSTCRTDPPLKLKHTNEKKKKKTAHKMLTLIYNMKKLYTRRSFGVLELNSSVMGRMRVNVGGMKYFIYYV